MRNHRQLMSDLKDKHAEILDLLIGRKFHYIEIPIHDNIGDLLIMQGTLAFLSRNKLRAKTMSTTQSFRCEWVKENDVLVFQGGGNFGDLYGNIHKVREEIVSRLPKNRIIILPQTIYFSSKEVERESADIFLTHKDVHLFVRDQTSFNSAKKFSNHVYLVPDMAHQLYPIRSGNSPTHRNVRIRRVDTERPNVCVENTERIFDKTTDWIDVIGGSERWIKLIWRFESFLNRCKFEKIVRLIVPIIWLPMAQRFSNRAVDLFGRHEHVFTDRLHGHILACLMDKPNTVFDNSYGKNSAYMNQWTIESDIVKLERVD
ncbi:polysaccharide pyruvyl transferase family protein [Paraburkholderia fungorum]|uniref:Polysaccharide pyruvyl transferase family protein n=1 Tax=Paraburkholderia fungorum TaxID=134537 RepID=A0AAU8THB7_9BURK|nr:polysaccharide pyruvyl transferase family protein [Paraburkholderia fungorum]AJZ61208.1 polysaccharide pyruvyl transferase family protein [Paraburkholderia fungorum]